MRYWSAGSLFFWIVGLLGLTLLLSGEVSGQLSLAKPVLPLAENPSFGLTTAFSPTGGVAGRSTSLLGPPTVDQSSPNAFDFSRTRPHLAFFCRLEINEEKGGVIPLRFRLGEVRGWQQELPKRD